MRWHRLDTLERTAFLLAIYCLTVLILLAWKPSFTNASEPVRGIHDPLVAMQVVRDLDEVDAVLSDTPSADREVMRVKLKIDFAFIAGYVALGLVIAVALFRGPNKAARAVGIALALLAVLGGLHNVQENRTILAVVNSPLAEVTRPMLDRLHLMSSVKWAALALASLLLGGFALRKLQWQPRVIGVIELAGGALGLAGLFLNPLLVWAGVFIAAGLLLAGFSLKLLR